MPDTFSLFNSRNSVDPISARKELADLIPFYMDSDYEMFREFASLLKKYEPPTLSLILLLWYKKSKMEKYTTPVYPMVSLNH